MHIRRFLPNVILLEINAFLTDFAVVTCVPRIAVTPVQYDAVKASSIDARIARTVIDICEKDIR